MELFGYNFSKIKEPVSETPAAEPKARELITGNGGAFYGNPYNYSPIIQQNFDGEKTSGQMGYVIKSIPDYMRLRLRSYDAYLKSDTVKILINRKLQWVIGTGLKLEVEPNRDLLSLEGITVPEDFYKTIEARFKTFAGSNFIDNSRLQNLHGIAWDAKMGIDLGGDMLVVCRIGDNGYPTVQLISGEFVQTPLEETLKGKEEGNYIENGIEFNTKGEHVAYYVKVKENASDSISLEDYERVPAYGAKSKKRMAWIIYGEKISNDHKRGIPKLTQILEKVNKMDRYTEASVAKAEQAANLVFAIEHQDYSTGENPLKDIINKGYTKKIGEGKEADSFALSDAIAQNMAVTTNGMAVNLPPGSKLNSFSTNIESSYGDFTAPNMKSMSASMDVPQEVAEQSYNSNYSASRAAINGWGFINDIDADKFSKQFYKPIYQIWLETEILRNKVNAPGYVKAMTTGDFMITEAYAGCRFVGKKMPHIDPVKEVKAVEIALGLKLISREQAAEIINAGDWIENYEEAMEEQKLMNEKFVKDDTTAEVEGTNASLEQQTTV